MGSAMRSTFYTSISGTKFLNVGGSLEPYLGTISVGMLIGIAFFSVSRVA